MVLSLGTLVPTHRSRKLEGLFSLEQLVILSLHGHHASASYTASAPPCSDEG